MRKFLAFLKTHHFGVLFLIILVFGIFLRFFKIEENLIFHGELGDNYLAIKNFIEAKQIPLLGPPTSHPWLSFGPLFYWIFPPILIAFNYQPIAGAYFFAVVGVIVILLNYIFVSKIFNKQIGLISSSLISFSPSFIDLTRQSRFFSLVLPLLYPFYYFVIKIFEGSKKYLFWLGFVFGIMLNFHYTPLIFLPVIFVAFLKNRKLFIKADYFKTLIGFTIPNLPFLIYNFKTNFVMIKEFSLWIPYRLLGFGGFIPKNNLTWGGAVSSFVSLSLFISDQFFPFLNTLAVVVFLIFVVLVIFAIKNYRKDKSLMILLSLLIVGYLTLFIHGDPPSHYYLPLFPIPVIVVSYFLNKSFFRHKLLVFLILFFVFIKCASFYFSDRWFYGDNKTNFVKYSTQVEITKKIVQDAKGRGFTLARTGYNDNFTQNYAQNYRYLLWLEGNEPVDQASMKYTIYETDSSLLKPIFEIDGVAVTKEVYE